jgi:hypothetical protein
MFAPWQVLFQTRFIFVSSGTYPELCIVRCNNRVSPGAKGDTIIWSTVSDEEEKFYKNDTKKPSGNLVTFFFSVDMIASQSSRLRRLVPALNEVNGPIHFFKAEAPPSLSLTLDVILKSKLPNITNITVGTAVLKERHNFLLRH